MIKSRLLILFIAILLLVVSGCNTDAGVPDGDTDASDGDIIDVDGDIETDGDTEIDGDVEIDGEDEQPPVDPCDPNPCNAADNRVCEAGTGVCLCDTDFCDITTPAWPMVRIARIMAACSVIRPPAKTTGQPVPLHMNAVPRLESAMLLKYVMVWPMPAPLM